ncbi:hypothetical protein EG028_03035 [Chitinophaga barathri]|uniref:Uncharacterized protein n=1 Tax=Chitinophaga barathri TaxID=1647451 RepID=A0A3N4MMQ6_9BACT|nr:hypothetical protein EG028_03035 [Chitinophaga barathri]
MAAEFAGCLPDGTTVFAAGCNPVGESPTPCAAVAETALPAPDAGAAATFAAGVSVTPEAAPLRCVPREL